MKKVWTLIACFAACLSLAACGTDSNSSTPGQHRRYHHHGQNRGGRQDGENHRGDNRGDKGRVPPPA